MLSWSHGILFAADMLMREFKFFFYKRKWQDFTSLKRVKRKIPAGTNGETIWANNKLLEQKAYSKS